MPCLQSPGSLRFHGLEQDLMHLLAMCLADMPECSDSTYSDT